MDPQVEAKIDRILSLEAKIDKVLELQMQAQKNARWAIFWKFFWIFLLVILPMYLSYKAISAIDFSGMMESLESLKGLSDTTSGANADLSEILKSIQSK